MEHPKNLRIEDFTYTLPEDRIAKYPLPVRDDSKLLIYKNDEIQEDIYRNISAHIPSEALLVFNQTKVIHARLIFKKPSGGLIEVFCLEPHEQYADIQTAMLQKGKVWWKCMIGGASKWKHGLILQLRSKEPQFDLTAKIVDRENGAFILELQWDDESLTFAEVLHYAGAVPLPPYLHREPETSDEERYQTIYAKEEGSVAAPTAGLHFTDNILADLKEKKIDTAFVTLHVSAGTFKPVKSETMEGHEMHAEWLEIDIDTVKRLTDHLDKKIVAVGTTSMRTLESLYWIGAKILQGQTIDFSGIAVTQWEPYEINSSISCAAALHALVDYMTNNGTSKLITRTQILIAPGYTCRVINGLITNFHQPDSTLLLLVAAVVGDAWQKIYRFALDNNYRFLSYGDGCLLWN
ncbi:MAG TPA: S-adenosylmethionine:tRNA ribosyltransferase-isomerase [Flavipsychrobacter sp.]|nr:S-adenosylmethionine:tRNA ribosyltransferase-isomerase [Flavipsychrobacter sp.]